MRLFLSALLITSSLSVFQPTVNAAGRIFKNCTELNKVYPGGVAMPGAVNIGGASKKEPKYSRALYVPNKKSDRDKDGIACEK